MLSIDNLSKKFGKKTILENVSLEIAPGSIGLLLGASGVGKSTLLRILNNLETYDSGTIMLDGKKLDINAASKIHTIGMVFQQFNLFNNLTVEANITLALEQVLHKSVDESKNIAHQLLKRFDLADKANFSIAQLSGGQKQRLAIARTIAMQPRIICMDEPTSALDPVLTSSVAALINKLAQEGYIILIASHDTTLLEKLIGRVYLMKQGTIISTAEIKDFKNHPEQYPLINEFISGIIHELY